VTTRPRKLCTIVGFCLIFSATMGSPVAVSGDVSATVNVITDRLPIEFQDKMIDFHKVVKDYVDNGNWLEEDDKGEPIPLTIQMFLEYSASGAEDRYTCEFLISGGDIQYFDRRMRFPYQTGDQLIFDPQNAGPLTSILDFYVYLILGNEFDSFREMGGDLYYKKALDTAELGKFVRTEYIFGWTERNELIRRIFRDPFPTLRKAKDHFAQALYEEGENIDVARKNVRQCLQLIEKVKNHEEKFDATKQFLDAHYTQIIDIFKEDENNRDVFEKMIRLDPDREAAYKEHIVGS